MNDGIAWGPWKNFTLTTTKPPNRKPVVSQIVDQRLAIDETKNISSLVKATDPDGDPIRFYYIKDTTGRKNFYVDNGFPNAQSGSNGYQVQPNSLKGLIIRGDAAGGEQTLQIAASDDVTGKEIGDWMSFKLITNGLPVVTIGNQNVKFNALKNISSAVSVSDVNKDTITKYKVKDTTGVNSFYVNGSAVNASGSNGYEFNASALSTLRLRVMPVTNTSDSSL